MTHLLLFYLGFILAAGLGQWLAIIPGIAITLWPPNGVFVATLLLNGRSSWPWWVATAGAAELTCNALWFHNPVLAASGFLVANALESVTAAFILGISLKHAAPLQSVRQVIAFLLVGVGLAPIIGATIGSAIDVWRGTHAFPTAWLLWWIGDATGVLLAAPLTLVLVEAWQMGMKFSRTELLEAAAVALVLLATCVVGIGGYLPFSYLVLPPLLWAAVRFEFKGAMLSVMFITLIVAVFTVAGVSQFWGDSGSQLQRHVMMQLFLAISASTALIVAAISREHRLTLGALRESYGVLEARVAERTRELQDSESRFRATFENAAVGIALVDNSGVLQQVNTSFVRILGYSPDECRETTFQAIAHPDDLANSLALHQKVFAGEADTVQTDTRYVRKDGGVVWAYLSCGCVRKADGSVDYLIVSIEDVTERKRAEEAVRQHNRQLDLLARTSQHLLLGKEPESALIGAVFQEVAELLSVEMFYHYRPSEDTSALLLHTFGGITEEEKVLFSAMRLGELLCGRVAETRARLIVEDLQNSSQPGSEVLAAVGAKSYAGFPLVTGERLLGTIAFVSRHRTHFREGEMQTIETICDQIAATLERSRLLGELRESEERARLALEGAELGSWDVDLRTGAAVWNRRHAELQGYAEDTGPASIERWRTRVHPKDLDRVTAAMERARIERSHFAVEHRLHRADTGEVRWLALYGRFSYDQTGEAVRFSGVSRDITERKQAELALRESEHRLHMALDAGAAGTWESVPDTGEFAASDRAVALYGLPPGASMTHEGVLEAIHPDDRLGVEEGLRQTLESGEPFRMDLRVIQPDGTIRWLHSQAVLRADSGSRRLVGLIQNITERKRVEEHNQLLMREVNHRAKNMLSLVQSIARQTAASDPQEFTKRFGERVQALAASQDLLVKSGWRSIPLEALVRSQLEHFRDLLGTRITLSGPDLHITAPAAQAIGLALHELATNAAKHGALSNETGHVETTWEISTNGASEPHFFMSWTEMDGPKVAQPVRRGFGSTVTGSMIEMSLEGDVTLDYAPTGLVWRLTCAASKVIEGAHAAQGWNKAVANPALLAGPKRVLVVEDDALIAIEIADALAKAGFEVVGPATSVAQAVKLLDLCGCDAAVLDVNLGSETAVPIAEKLTCTGTPFITLSGYGRDQQPAAFASAPYIAKPLRPELLVAEIARCLAA